MRLKRAFESKAISGKVQRVQTPTGARLRERPDTNVRPGDRMGLDSAQVQELIRSAKRVKGQSYDLSVGDNENLSVQLPGTSYVLLGFVFGFSISSPTGNGTLTINNEIVLDSCNVNFFGSDYTDEEYYFIPRPLSGQDDIKFSVNDVLATYTLHVNYYYL